MASKIILFDLGGVLVDLGDPVAEIGLSLSSDEFWKLWLSSPIVRGFETGRVSTTEFTARFGKVLGFGNPQEFERRIRRWKLPLFDGAEAYLQELGDRAEIALLSNTNAIHWQHVLSQTDVFGGFENLFLSFETGHAKPDVTAFRDVIEHFDCAPDDVVFVDDSPANIAAATEFGFDAHQTAGIDAAKQVVSAYLA